MESALLEHPAVEESAVVSSPDVDRGSVVKVPNKHADNDAYPWGNKDFSMDVILISLRPYYSLLSNNVVF